LEYDTERAGTFAPLKHLPLDKSLVLGLISSKIPELENEEAIKKRVIDAATSISNGNIKRPMDHALNQICISPQCGFASHSEGNKVTEQDVEMKLKLVSRVASRCFS